MGGGTVPSWGMDSPYLNATAVGFDSNMSLHYKPPPTTPHGLPILILAGGGGQGSYGKGLGHGSRQNHWGTITGVQTFYNELYLG